MTVNTGFSSTYRGSNAEYIVYKADRSELSESEYLSSVVPILRLQFPRLKTTEAQLTEAELIELDRNERDYLNTLFHKQGFETVTIPKTFYDLFYLAYRCETLRHAILSKNPYSALESLDRFTLPSTGHLYTDISQISPIGPDQYFIETEHSASKIDFELNQYIAHEFSEHKSRKNPQELIAAINDIIATLRDSESSGNRVDPGHHLGLLRMCCYFADERYRAIWLHAIQREWTQDPSIYTLYRGGTLSLTRYPQPFENCFHYSVSFGPGICSSIEHDDGAIPFNFMCQWHEAYGLEINKTDYRTGTAHRLLHIPPAQRTERFRIVGELTHARTKIYDDGSHLQPRVHGLGTLTALETPKKTSYVQKLPYLFAQNHFSSAQEFTGTLEQYFTTHSHALWNAPYKTGPLTCSFL